MKKKYSIALALIPLLFALFVGCGIHTETVAPAVPVTTPGPTRGVWDGDVFISEYFGLQFTLPDDWVIATDDEIAAWVEQSATLLDSLDTTTYWGIIDPTTELFDMEAGHPVTSASVALSFSQLIDGYATAETYIEAAGDLLEQAGLDVNLDFPEQIKVGNYDWYIFSSLLDMAGTQTWGHYFVNAHDGFIRTISIYTTNRSKTPAEIVPFFTDNNGVPAEAPPTLVATVPEAEEPEDEPEPPTTSSTTEPTPGIWDGNTFISEYLGFRFELPRSWVAADEEELAGYYDDTWGFSDLHAFDPFSGASIWIDFERLVFPRNRMTELDFLQQEATWYKEDGYKVSFDFSDTTRIGNYDWLSFDATTKWEGFDDLIFARVFVSIHDGFARIIFISYTDYSKSLDEILALFDTQLHALYAV